ncbi:putative bifunctional diguanylate cyclase/phosphodiesterase [Streptacidiphilus anmyonensis]|uniref:putative bifunctional diguanylate cyclase/phosphodiesterase n=1 Tax=Streptacidiphilus anmyonensis TaxID=405782 RepID=UPI00128C3F5A|nr:EAL domain-containing protein [Streptacidiphilus anmyonensis]
MTTATRWRPDLPVTVFCVWTTALVCLYYAFSAQRFIFVAVGLSGVAGIVLGLVRNRPSHPLPWLLLAAANLTFTLGELAQIVLIQYEHEDPVTSIADAFYLVTYVLYAAGLLGFIRWRSSRQDRASLVDALTLTAALALLSWVYVIVPYAHTPGQTWFQRAVSITYPLGDILVLAMLLRLLAPRGGKSLSLVLLTIGTVGLLAADVAYAQLQLHGVWRTGTPVDLGWAVFYGAWGAAALHPSMRSLTEPVAVRHESVHGWRLGLLAVASLTAPVMLLIAAARGDNGNAGVIGAFSAVLFLLVLHRLSGVAATHRQALARERVLRAAATGLGDAESVADVALTVTGAARVLLDGGHGRSILFAVRDERGSWCVRTQDGDPEDKVIPSFAARDDLAAVASGSTREVRVAELPGPLREHFSGGHPVLVCPLAAQDRAAKDPPELGALLAESDEWGLASRRDSLATLATQAALAVQRILLSREVSRRKSEAYFRTLVQNASDVILILGDDDTVRYASPSAAQVLGSTRLTGSRFPELVVPQERRIVRDALAQMRVRDSDSRRDHWRMRRADEGAVEVEVRCSDLRADPTVGGLVLTLRDVTEQRNLERELTHRAFHDPLTGLANRLLFQERVSHALAQSHREGTVVGVLFVDVDDFKIVNDVQGHGVGDELLVALALRLSTTVRASDTAARIGGDEFALLIEDPMTPADVEAFADHVLEVFGEPFQLSVGPVSAYVSVGIATTEDSYDSVELLTHADLALYEAKTAGKRQWRHYHPSLQSGMLERHELQDSLNRAEVDSFQVLYQPIVELASGKVDGFEALLRWPHSTRGVVMPEQFISLAEESGQIVPLGGWVLDLATTEAVGWHRLLRERHAPGGAPVWPYVSINVSPRQFHDPGFLGVMHHALEQSGIAPSSVVLELTESLLIRRDERILAQMQDLTDLGIRIAIDDFGTGYSSLSYLREFPISILKIDRTFIDELGRSPQQYALVEGITHLADTLGVAVIAEGVETSRQQELLIALGCQRGQGYLFAQPMDAASARQLLLESPTGAFKPSALRPGVA